MGNSEASRGLEKLGLSESEARAYACLVQSEGASPRALGRLAGLSESRTRQLLASLEEKGLVSRSATDVPDYVPVPPHDALEFLAVRREQEIREARLLAARFLDEFGASIRQGASTRVVEVTVGGKAVVNRSTQMLGSAKEEILGLCTLPMARVNEKYTSWKLEILARGIECRAVYDLQILEVPGIVDFIRKVGAAGEEARTVPSLPMPIIIVDRRAALLPLTPGLHGYEHEYLVVHESSLLDSLVILFEGIWERASPFDMHERDGSCQKSPEVSAEDRTLLAMLAAGMRDTAIARQMHVVPRTIERRLQRIMHQLGTRTRFQTAVEAGRRGWLDASLTNEDG